MQIKKLERELSLCRSNIKCLENLRKELIRDMIEMEREGTDAPEHVIRYMKDNMELVCRICIGDANENIFERSNKRKYGRASFNKHFGGEYYENAWRANSIRRHREWVELVERTIKYVRENGRAPPFIDNVFEAYISKNKEFMAIRKTETYILYECPDCGFEMEKEDVEFECPYCFETDPGEGYYRCEDCGTLFNWEGDYWECKYCHNGEEEEETYYYNPVEEEKHKKNDYCPGCGEPLDGYDYCECCGWPDNQGWLGEHYG